jgi:hypothetical protein
MAIVMINNPVAGPLLLNIAWRKGTSAKRATTAIRFNFPNCTAVNFLFCESPKVLGKRLVVAKGQTFLHTPTATTNNAGATGIKIFQKRMSPTGGKNKRQVSITAPTNQTPDCATLQRALDFGDRSIPDLKGA